MAKWLELWVYSEGLVIIKGLIPPTSSDEFDSKALKPQLSLQYHCNIQSNMHRISFRYHTRQPYSKI